MANIDSTEENKESQTHSSPRDVLFDIDDDGMTCADSLKRNYLEQDFFTSPKLSSQSAPPLSATALSTIDDTPREEQDFVATVQRIYVVSCLLPVDVFYQVDSSSVVSRLAPGILKSAIRSTKCKGSCEQEHSLVTHW